MKRRPFLLLSLVIAAAALMHALLSPASPPVAESDAELPPGMVCTTCGPIPSAFRDPKAPPTLPPLTELPRPKPAE